MFALSRSAQTAWPPPQVQPTTVARCVVLAALVHALLVALLGSTPGGTARPGEGVWGPVNILLRGSGESGATAAVAQEAYSGPLGSATQRRFGGAVRDDQQAPRANDGPGADKLGSWRATVSEQATELTAGAPPPVPLAVTAPHTAGPAETAADAAMARIVTPTPQSRLPLPRAPSAAASPEPAPLPQAPAPEPAATPSISERVAPPTAQARPSETTRAAPAEDEARLKMIDSAPALAPPRAAAPTALERIAPAAVTPLRMPAITDAPATPRAQLDAPVQIKPMPALAAASAALSAPSTPATQSAIEPVLRSEPLALPAVAPLPAALRAQLDAPVQLKAMPSLASGSAEPATVPAAAATGATPTPTPTQTPTSIPGTTPGAPANASNNQPGASPLGGAPDAGARVGRDVATSASTAASAARLNLDLPRPRGGEIGRETSRGVLQLLPHPPERKSKLEDEIAKAAKKDCREAYSGLGLLAVIPLAANAVTEKCKW